MSIDISNWVRRFLFTEWRARLRAAWQQERWLKKLFFAVVLLPPFLFLVLTVILPLWADPLGEFVETSGQKQPAADTTLAATRSTAPNPQSSNIATLLERLHAIEIEEAFLQSRLELSAGDSIGLSIDLTDSAAAIEIKGVQVRACKLARIHVSGGLALLRQRPEVVTWLSSPFVLQSEAASLPKAPIRVEDAPSDTIEAREKDNDEISIEHRDAYFILHFDKNLSVSVAQTQRTSAVGWLHRLGYVIKRGWSSALDDLAALAQGRLPAGRVQIRLEMPREDAKAIYRALPPRAEMALRL